MNLELARLVRKAIEADPSSHDQCSWAKQTECGTAMCIAGHTVNLTGGEMVWQQTIHWVEGKPYALGFPEASKACDSKGNTYDIDDWAAELLDINPVQAARIFYDYGNKGALMAFDRQISTAEREAENHDGHDLV